VVAQRMAPAIEVGEMRFAVAEVGSEPGWLAYWMRRWRGATDLTATEAAKRVGISISRMSDYENGAMPPLTVVLNLAEVYGVAREQAVNVYAEEDRRRQLAKREDFVVLGEPALAVYPITPELRLFATQLAETDISADDLTAMRLAIVERRKANDEAAAERSRINRTKRDVKQSV
jgi:transcriptional regulator with XRE-family HTH domain